MKASKNQFAGLVIVTGMCLVMAGCFKESNSPSSRNGQQPYRVGESMPDSTLDGSGDEDGPKFPPHPKREAADDSVGLSGDEDGPKFPPHPKP